MTTKNDEPTRDLCGIRYDGTRYSVWYGVVLVGYALTLTNAETKLAKLLDEELESANREVLKADDHRNYIVGERERIAREGMMLDTPAPYDVHAR